MNVACPHSITSPRFTVLKVLPWIPTGNGSPYSQVSTFLVCLHSTKGVILGGHTVVVHMHSFTGGLEFLKQSLRVEVRLSCNDFEEGETSQGAGAGKEAIPQSF